MDRISFQKVESFIFKIVVLLTALPILVLEFYPTMDGAAHLYNSRQLWSLVFENNEQVQQFYALNSEPVPNWTGHLLLAVFNAFLPAHVADSIVMLICVIGLPLAFRGLVKTIRPENTLLSYLIFPFVYSFTFTLGFYNFSIALVLLFFTLSYWLKKGSVSFSWTTVSVLSFLITATYFSHLFVFGILLLLLGIKEIHSLIISFSTREFGRSVAFKNFFTKAGVLISASFISLILFANYLLKRPYSEQSAWLPKSELLESLITISPIISYNPEIEKNWTSIIFYLLVLASVAAVFFKIRHLFGKRHSETHKPFSKKVFTKQSFWFIAPLVLIILYFTFPDSDGYAGYISTRIALLFFMFFILWLATANLGMWLTIIIACASVLVTFKFVSFYTKAVKPLNEIALNCVDASSMISENSVVLPLNHSDHWLLPHFSNYLGAEKPLVVLENYEASTGYFPVVWNEEKLPTTLFGEASVTDFECLHWKSGKSEVPVNIDFVFLLGTLDSDDPCSRKVQRILDSTFERVYSKGRVQLYKSK